MLPRFKIRSSRGCWTCRLRRKKCDEARPACAACAALEITCHYSDAKPAWMDGGPREKAMADEIKAMVKAKASERRERKWVQAINVDGEELTAKGALVMTAKTNSADNIAGLSQSLAAGMALDSSDATDREMGGTSPETNPSSASSYTGGYDHQQKQQQKQPRYETYHNTWNQTSRTTEADEATKAFTPTSSEAEAAAAEYTVTGPSVPEAERSERELQFVMIYLDYVLPFLFPFYRPSLAESGRGWLLVLLMKNKSLFHTALSLSSYFFSVSLEEQTRSAAAEQAQTQTQTQGSNKQPLLTPCQEASWLQLQTQTGLAIRQLHSDMRALNARGGVPATPLMDAVRCLEAIIQLLQFEAAVAASPPSARGAGGEAAASAPGNWPLHLDAATALFSQLITHHAFTAEAAQTAAAVRRAGIGGEAGTGDGGALGPWATVLWRMAGPLQMTLLERDPFAGLAAARRDGPRYQLPWSSDQSAFRFYTAYLVFADVVASTATGEAPRLQAFHAEILGGGGDGDGEGEGEAQTGAEAERPSPQLALEDFVGCQSWAIRLLGEVAALAAWKRAQCAAGTLCTSELLQRAACLEARLARGIARLEAESPYYCCPVLAPDTAAAGTNGWAGQGGGACRGGPAAGYPHQPWGGGGGFGLRSGGGDVVGGAGPALLAALHTRIWAQATLTYLRVAVHGFWPDAGSDNGIVASVNATLPLLRRALILNGAGEGENKGEVQGGDGLRTLAWPFAITGCCLPREVADEGGNGDGGGQGRSCGRALFESAVAGMGGMRVFGTLGEALLVVRRVWEHRAAGLLSPEAWDVAACLGVLGHRVLLV